MSLYKTDNGVDIHVGLRVFTNDWSWGTVVEEPAEWDENGWYKVKIDDDAEYCAGQTKTYNGERMTTRAPLGAPRDPRLMEAVERTDWDPRDY